MIETQLAGVARSLVAGDRGLLAMDESNRTCNERFAAVGIVQTVEARRAYRELIVTTPNLGDCISGAILYDETIHQHTTAGISFVDQLVRNGIIPGIKVDIGEFDLAGHPGEMVTEGLDGLRPRLAEYRQMGARFAKWRAVFDVGDTHPSAACLDANAGALARYAALCQEAGLVPVVEPEVLMAGSHGLASCATVTEAVLRAVFDHLSDQGVALEAMLLKPNMVLPGLDCAIQDTVEDVAAATLRCLRRTVPAAVPGVVFLSGGQSPELASARLSALNAPLAEHSGNGAPWALAFSFARAIQAPALTIWAGEDANGPDAQAALYYRADCNRLARSGLYQPALDSLPARAVA